MPIPRRMEPVSNRGLGLFFFILSLIVVLSVLGLIWLTDAQAATYYMRADGIAVNKTVATSCGAAATAMSMTTHNAETFSAGDTIVLCNDGGIFRSQLTVPSSGSAGLPITYSASGSPVITGADSVIGVSGDWTEQGDGVWRKNIGATTPNTVIFNSATIGTLDATPDTVYEWTYSNPNLDVYTAPGDNNPATYYSAIEAGQRGIALDTNDQSYITISGLTLRDGNVKGGSSATLYAGGASVVGIIVDGCTIERGRGAGIWAYAATTATSITVTNCIVRYNGYIGIQIDAVDSFTGGTISGNTIYQNGKFSLPDVDQAAGIQGCLGNLNIFGNTIYNNVETTDASKEGQSHGIYHASGTGTATIYTNTIYGHAHGHGVKVKSPATIYRNNIYTNTYYGIQIGGNAGNVIYLIWGNIIHDNITAGLEEESKTGTINLTVNNNTFYNNGGTVGVEWVVNEDIENMTVKNNVFFATAGRRTMRLSVAQTGTVAINNNLHWRADGNPWLYYAGADHSWAEWQGHGFDTAGLNADPLFINAAGGNFRLKYTSPAKDAGIDVGLGLDYDGRSVPLGTAPDMGAYEYSDPDFDVRTQAIQGVTTTLPVLVAQSPDSSPALSSATIGTDGVTWTFVMTHAVQFGAGGNGGWTVATSGQGVITLTYSSGTGTNTLIYQGNKAVGIGETISSGLNYTQPGDGIKDLNGLEMATSGPFAVANNSVTSPFTMSAKGFSSFSASGTIYMCSITLTTLGQTGNESGGKLFSSFSFDVGSAISDVSLFESFPSTSFTGSAGVVKGSQEDSYPSATLQDIGTFLGQSGFISFPDYTFSILAQILPSYVYLPALDSTTMAVAGAYTSESRYDPQASLTFAIAGSAVMVSTTGGGGIYYESATIQAFAQSTTSSNAVYGNSITYLVGDYFQYPTFNMPVTFSDIGEMALSNTAIQYPPQRYYLSTINAISVSVQYTSYPDTTYAVLGQFATSTVGQVYAASTSLDIVTASAGGEGYTQIALPISFAVDTSAIDNTNQIDWYPMYEYIVASILESIYYMGAGEASTTIPVLVAFDGSSYLMHPSEESAIYSAIASLVGEGQFTIPDIRTYGDAFALISVTYSVNEFSGSISFNVGAGFASTSVLITYPSADLQTVATISELARAIQNISITLPTRAYENSLFRKPANLFWWMQYKFF